MVRSGEFGGRAVVVAAVGDLVADDALGFGVAAFGAGDGDQVQAGDLFVGGGDGGGFGGPAGGGGVAVGEGVGGDGVGDVDDRGSDVLVEAVAVDEPGPAAGGSRSMG